MKGYDVSSLTDYGLTSTVEGENYAVKISTRSPRAAFLKRHRGVARQSPAHLTPADAEHGRTYLAGGGRLMVLLDLEHLAVRRPLLEELLGNYGLGVQRLLVVEGDTNRTPTAAVLPVAQVPIPRHRVPAVSVVLLADARSPWR